MKDIENYEQFFQEVIERIESARSNILIIKEKALIEMYWGIGESLLLINPLSDAVLRDVKTQMNEQMAKDRLLRDSGTNTHWLKLARLWVKEHAQHDKSIVLSGIATWVDWALVLDVVNVAAQRYWLICQKIKNDWDISKLLRETLKLPEEYLNVGEKYNASILRV